MAGGDSILGAGCRHAHHFLRAQIRRNECQAADPGRDRAACEKEGRAGPRVTLQQRADRYGEDQVGENDHAIDDGQVHCQSSSGPMEGGGSSSPTSTTFLVGLHQLSPLSRLFAKGHCSSSSIVKENRRLRCFWGSPLAMVVIYERFRMSSTWVVSRGA